MKKVFLIAGSCTLSVLICIHTNAQHNLAHEYAGIRTASPNNTGSKHYINDINIKAVRYFKQRYKDVSNEIWSKNYLGEYLAYFTLNGTATRLFFDRQGKWHTTLKTYTEDKLPFIIRDKIKSKYYDYSIRSINEIITADSNGLPTYIVDIKYKNDTKIIRIYDGEMEVWKHLKQP
ncbi:MAG: hypothetical protein KF746_16610 [Chitinophagaceae bacterium]|nr:hypothetical protein [Chitinophagaceae bacterium]